MRLGVRVCVGTVSMRVGVGERGAAFSIGGSSDVGARETGAAQNVSAVADDTRVGREGVGDGRGTTECVSCVGDGGCTGRESVGGAALRGVLVVSVSAASVTRSGVTG